MREETLSMKNRTLQVSFSLLSPALSPERGKFRKKVVNIESDALWTRESSATSRRRLRGAHMCVSIYAVARLSPPLSLSLVAERSFLPRGVKIIFKTPEQDAPSPSSSSSTSKTQRGKRGYRVLVFSFTLWTPRPCPLFLCL